MGQVKRITVEATVNASVAKDGKTKVETTFDAETENDPEMQKQGWQAILNNLVKLY